MTSTSYTFAPPAGTPGPSISGLPNGISITPTTTNANSVTWEATGNALTLPGTYVVTVAIQDPCGANGQGTANFTFVVNTGATQPVAETYYTGATFFWTSGSSSSTATLTLSATLKNANCLGDIRTATVSFWTRDPNTGALIAPIKGAQNLTVGLVNPGDTTTGTASAIVQYGIGSSATTLTIAVVVGGNYYLNDPTTDVPVTIAIPVAGGQICGGGKIDDVGSAGYLAGGLSRHACFSFYVQYSKSGSNPQGGVQIVEKSYGTPYGTNDVILHTYMFKSTAISVLSRTLGTTTTPSTAQFSSKANVIEILSNGTESSIEGNDVMTMSLTDGSTIPGNTTKTLAITIQRTKGGTWYSSSWDGTKTNEKQITSGNVSVK
jgi:hypothetical protein